MNKWKLAFFIVVPILFVGNIIFAYAMFDTAVSLSYLSDSYNYQNKSKEQLSNLIVLGSKDYSQADILHLLRQSNPIAFIVEDGDKVSMGETVFIFENNRLTSVK